jgi:hypothetical protein
MEGFSPIMAMPGVQSGTWGPPVRMIADRLGVELDEIRETYQKVVTPRRLEVAAGTIDAGTVGKPETASDEGMVATTMRLVNAIPYVCDAPAGLATSLDLPLTTPKFAL